jgi:acyl-coenzyme A thioesterase PaaI-like protein
LLTTQLTTTFLRPARGGDLVEAEARVVELGRTIASSVVNLAVDGRTIGHAAALFRVAPATGRPGPASLGDRA